MRRSAFMLVILGCLFTTACGGGDAAEEAAEEGRAPAVDVGTGAAPDDSAAMVVPGEYDSMEVVGTPAYPAPSPQLGKDSLPAGKSKDSLPAGTKGKGKGR